MPGRSPAASAQLVARFPSPCPCLRRGRLVGRMAHVLGITQGWVLPGLAAAYTFGIAASLMLAWYTPAFMPLLTYGNTPEYQGREEPSHNRLLSHSDGSWHFLHRKKLEDGREYRIVSLADGEAKFVRVRPHRATAFRVAPFPWSEDAV